MKLFSVISILLAMTSLQGGNNISEWRGRGRTGVYNENNLLRVWPAEGPEEVFTLQDIGNGYGSPVFDGEKFYITGEKDTACFLYCFDLKGSMLWKADLGREWVRSCPGSRSAPTVAGGLVYAGTGLGNLFCLDKNNGKKIWSKDLAKDFGGVLPLHGHSESPLLDGDKIFWTAGGKVHNVVCLNRFTGKLIWTSKGFGEASGYNQPKLIVRPSGNIMVTFSSYHLMGFDSNTGQMLWSHEQDNFPPEKRGPGYGDTHCNSVIYENGAIWYVAGDGNGGVRLDLSPDGRKITQAWRNQGFDSYMGGTVKLGNYLFCGTTAHPQMKSINAQTGVMTDSLKIGTGALIAADDMIYYYTQKGEMVLVKNADGKLTKVSSFKITKGQKEHFSHPVIYRGTLYVRHGSVLLGYDIKKR